MTLQEKLQKKIEVENKMKTALDLIEVLVDKILITNSMSRLGLIINEDYSNYPRGKRLVIDFQFNGRKFTATGLIDLGDNIETRLLEIIENADLT